MTPYYEHAGTVGSLFTGIGGFDLGFEHAGFQVCWQVENDKNAWKVLNQRWPTVPVITDINAVAYGRAKNRKQHGLVLQPVDVLCGGFPCQDLSVAGKRQGLAGARSGLFFAFMRMVRLLKPKTVVIENVPGLLSSCDGRDFATVLHALGECGYGWAFRVLDSRYFGVPQRRRRVFIVGCAGGQSDRAAAILFESHSSDRDTPSSCETGPIIAATLRGRSARAGVNEPGRGGEDDQNIIAFNWNSARRQGTDPTTGFTSTLNGNHGPAIAFNWQSGGDCRLGVTEEGVTEEGVTALHSGQVPAVFATLNSGGNDGGFRTEPGEHLLVAHALTATMHKRHDTDTDTDTLIANCLTPNYGKQVDNSDRNGGPPNLVTHSLTVQHGVTEDGTGRGVPLAPSGVRRLTPLECERLQGFPDMWTCLCGASSTATCKCSDTPRYKQCGNAVTVPVIRWIAERIKLTAPTLA